MALSASTLLGTRATIASAGTSVAPATALPDNCHTMVLLNRAPGHTVFMSTGTPGGAIADNGTQLATIPAASSLTLAVGVLAERVTRLDNLIFDCDAGNANVDITYLCTSNHHSG